MGWKEAGKFLCVLAYMLDISRSPAHFEGCASLGSTELPNATETHAPRQKKTVCINTAAEKNMLLRFLGNAGEGMERARARPSRASI